MHEGWNYDIRVKLFQLFRKPWRDHPWEACMDCFCYGRIVHVLGLLGFFLGGAMSILAQGRLAEALPQANVGRSSSHGLSSTVSRTYAPLATQLTLSQDGRLGQPFGKKVVGPQKVGLAQAQQSPPKALHNDFNGDGRSELLWRNGTSGMVYVMPLLGSEVQAGAVIWTEPEPQWVITGSGDLDGDRKADLVWHHRTTGMVYGMLMDGLNIKGGGVIHVEADTQWKIQAVADFDGDGMSDLLWRNEGTGMVYLMPLNGLTQLPGAVIWTETDATWQILGAGDFDGDGKADILWRNTSTGMLYAMLMNGTAIHSGTVMYTEPDTTWLPVVLADITGDGTTDLVWRNTTSGMVYAMPIQVAQPQAGAVLHTEPDAAWQIVATGDFDGDGKGDIVWANRTTGQVYQMQLNGPSLKAGAMIWNEPDTTWQIQAGGVRLAAAIAAPCITSLTANPATISAGGSTTLSYTFSGGTGLLTPTSTVVTSGSGLVVKPTATTTYTLTVTGPGGPPVTAQVTVVVVPAPDATISTNLPNAPYVTLSEYYSFSVPSQANCSYQWSFRNGDFPEASFVNGSISSKVWIRMGRDLGILSLQCVVTNNVSGVSSNKHIDLTLVREPYIESFTVSSAMISKGESSTITSVFSDYYGVTAVVDQGIGTVISGKAMSTGVLTQAKTYTLIVSNLARSTARAQVSVQVLGAPGSSQFNLIANRIHSTSSKLQNGKILLIGGQSPSKPYTEIIDPLAQVSLPGPALGTDRVYHTATTLPDGRILVVGGQGNSPIRPVIASAELYDPNTNTFSFTGSMGIARRLHTATLLPDGQVLVAGGRDASNATLASAEIYNPVLGTFSPAGAMQQARDQHHAVLLADGLVLIMGGTNNSAEVYNPVTGTFSPLTSILSSNHWLGASVRLNDGRVLIAGGGGGDFAAVDLYDPATQTFSTKTMLIGRVGLTATLLNDGRVIFAGGEGKDALMEIFDPTIDTFQPFRYLQFGRNFHTATVVSSTRVIFAGGYATDFENTAELYDVVSLPPPLPPNATITTNLSNAPFVTQNKYYYNLSVPFQKGCTYQWSFLNGNPTGASFGGASTNDRVSIHTGNILGTLSVQCVVTKTSLRVSNTSSVALTLVPSPQIQSFTASPSVVANGSSSILSPTFTTTYGETAVIDQSIGPVMSGTGVSTGALTQAKIFTLTVTNRAGDTVQAAANVAVQGAPGSNLLTLLNSRIRSTANLLSNGKVLLIGGCDSSIPHVELVDPWTKVSVAGPTMAMVSNRHTATTLGDGRILVVGGRYYGPNPGLTPRAELYNPNTGTFSPTGSMGTARENHAATLLTDGKVLVTGGHNNSDNNLASAEIYDPVAGTFTPTGSMNHHRSYHHSVLLLDGRVLVVGGSTDSAELYNPVTGTFSLLTSRPSDSYYAGASLRLKNGQIIIASGSNYAGADLYDPVTQTFSTKAMVQGGLGLTATLMGDGRVLFAGGRSNNATSKVEVYDPTTGAFQAIGSLRSSRAFHTATLVSPTQILFAGGELGVSNTAELFELANVPKAKSNEHDK